MHALYCLTSVSTTNKNPTFIENTDYIGILKADQRVYNIKLEMIEIAKNS